jgi:ParB family chromosome partitioning protein
MEFLSQVARGEFSILEPSPSEPEAKGAQSTKGASGNKVAGSTKKAAPVRKTAKAAESSEATPSLKLVPSTDPALAGDDKDQLPKAAQADIAPENAIQWLNPTDVVANPYQPRRHFDPEELQSLVDSVREHGILQPIIVRPLVPQAAGEGPRFQLVAGERRWRAAQAAKLEAVPAIVRQVSDQQALELAVIENVQRHDITPLDAATAYRRLADEFGLSQERIAQRVGKSRSAIANTLRLLDLPEEIQQSLNDGALSEGHGRAILLANSEGARRAAFRHILREKLSVREAEELSRRLSEGEGAVLSDNRKSKDSAKNDIAVDLRDITDELQRLLGSRVHVNHRRRGGQIVINYASVDEMNRIIDVLRKAGEHDRM